MTDTIRRVLEFPQPPDAVWHAITDSAAVERWMYPNDLQARAGHRFTFRVPQNPDAKFDGVVNGEVLVCTPPAELAYSWVAGGYGREVNTHVSYRLEPHGSGTRVLFEHSGFEMEQTLRGAEYGWTLMHAKLSRLLTEASAARRNA